MPDGGCSPPPLKQRGSHAHGYPVVDCGFPQPSKRTFHNLRSGLSHTTYGGLSQTGGGGLTQTTLEVTSAVFWRW